MRSLAAKSVSFILSILLVFTLLPAALMAQEDDRSVIVINGSEGYPTLQAALEAAVDGDTLTLVSDIFLAGPKSVRISGGITLDLGGHCLRLYDVAENADGEAGDEDEPEDITGGVLVLRAGTLTVTDQIVGAPQRGSIVSTNQSWPVFWLEGDEASDCLIIENGVFKATGAGCIGVDGDYGDSAVSISGGNFSAHQPDWFIAEGYVQVLQDDSTYEVEPAPTPAVYTITWQNYDGTVLESDSVNEGDTPEYDSDTPVKPEDDDYTYEFAGWDQEIVPAESDAVYTAVFNAVPKPTPAVYTITWQNYDGTVLESDSVNEGDTPSYGGDTPGKPEDDDYTYEFAGWDQEIVPAQSDAVYTAVYNAVPKPTPVPAYTIIWQNYDGTVLESDIVNEGDTPSYGGDIPVKPEDDGYTYEFAGWDQEIVPAQSDAVYTAVYNAVPKPTEVPVYTITWQNYDGTVLESDSVNEGDTPVYYGSTPVKPEDAGNTYQFYGWNPQVVPAAADAAYTAVYNAVPKPTPVPVYTITWKNYDGTVLSTSQVSAGTVPVYSGANPVRPSDSQNTYTFAGWQPRPAAAAANAVYTAVFSSQPVPSGGFVPGTVTLYSFASSQVQEGYPVFYQEGTSDNPYVDLAAAFDMMNGWYQSAGRSISFTTSYNTDPQNRVFTIVRENGAQAVYDPAANTLTFQDFEGFTDYAEAAAAGVSDGILQRISADRVYPHKPASVTVSLKDYGFSGSDVNGKICLPAAVFSGIFLAPAGMNWISSGQQAFITDGSQSLTAADDEGVSLQGRITSAFSQGRSQASADASYGELCLMMDLYCGHKEDLGIFGNTDSFLQQIGLKDTLRSVNPDDYQEALGRLSAIFGNRDAVSDQPSLYEENAEIAILTIAGQPDASIASDMKGLLAYANQQIQRQDSPVKRVVIDLTEAAGHDMEFLLSLISWTLGQADLPVQKENTGSGQVLSCQADIDGDGQITGNDSIDPDTMAVFVLTGPGTRDYANAAAAILGASGKVTLAGQTSEGGDSRLLCWIAPSGEDLIYPGNSAIRILRTGVYTPISSGTQPDIYLRDLGALSDRDVLAGILNEIK